ncbi:hypothetical protein FH972_024639 [Carpinus fangiana]|uniref:BZIP domain-containing protein n=1 Tax=Carpinus fangiana TaxID=176857 RepID=A0A5N6KZ16_9ROSI|nr:hypothetical protein FH972_024639 [Carpinus fangiana]
MPRASPDVYSPSETTSQSPPSAQETPPAIAPTGGLTKTWTIPPRPKPGRKPATDTPPSKRKAQNREAQRAFRERRAARVGELEDELRQRDKEHESEKHKVKAQWEEQRVALQQEIATWRVRSENWERVVKEKETDIAELRKQVEQLNLSARWNNNTSYSSPKASWDHQISPTAQRPPILPLPIPSKHDILRPNEPPTPSADCRKCGEGGHCACVEKILSNLPEPASKPTPTAMHVEVKQEYPEEMEIDFTAKFATARPREDAPEPIIIDEDEHSPGGSIRVTDGCGFCTDETNCLCIQNAQADPASTYDPPYRDAPSNKLPPISKPQPMEPASGAGGPGSCPSCVMDPERRRFCQALAGVAQEPSAPRRPSRPQHHHTSPSSAVSLSAARPASNGRDASGSGSRAFGSIDARMSCSDTDNATSMGCRCKIG